jgi:MarR family transcriptional regulator, 2-MHQ and catechol-resistance regulon repressor
MHPHSSSTPTEAIALDTFVKFMRAADSVSARVHQHLEAVNLTISQFGVLEALLHLGSMCQKDLAKKILKSGGNLTLVIDNLEKRQLVRRERDSRDRRIILVHLTEAGEQLIREVFPNHVAAVVNDLKILSSQEQQTLGEFCRRVGRQE